MSNLLNTSELGTETTLIEYDAITVRCRAIYEKKIKDYGTSWRVMRPSSLTDQLFIKAQRVRNLQENEERKVDEGVEPEFMGLINYCIIGLIQLEMGFSDNEELSLETSLEAYDKHMNVTRELMLAKNHDYGEAWRDMRIESLTDLILVKLKRVKQIEDNQGATLISEGIDANYQDILNYSIFALIKLEQL